MSFKKFDQNKSRVDLIDPEFTLGVGKVLGHGAEKYGEKNFLECEEPERFVAAALRHILQYQAGEQCDEETGLSHLLHAATNLNILFQLEKEAGVEEEIIEVVEERLEEPSLDWSEVNTGWDPQKLWLRRY